MRVFSSRAFLVGVLSLFVALAVAGLVAGSAEADPSHDSITGGFTSHFEENVSVQARSGASGEDPSGHENATRSGNDGTHYRMDVTCLAVDGNLAAYTTLMTKSNNPDFPEGTQFVEFARDGDAPNGEGDGWDLVDVPPGDPANCAEYLDEAATAQDILGGNINIDDAQP